ncbi:alpha/beta hydrolase [Streptomyces sp. SID13666]|uniref:alpha/beta fold hydrolase n=1 Tax=unclassified Streptomyces TaxID=2593676 RepID=UPI0013C09198|nr:MULTISPECIES: alpha/beta hydrolase [unclassified Streptomyces]NEA54657.1 alpha/beta hydrolase [Streptomyces sp. SID13666]NEA70446.1 alpha/beta hydrolase [Streptomyces sp. SID13588]
MTGSPTRGDSAQFDAAYHAVLADWGMPVEPLALTSPYGVTHVNACGPQDGEPLVLLHGGGTTAASWYANAARLSRTRRLYAIDRIGEPGLSVRGGQSIRTTTDLCDWLDATLDGLGLERTDICGHSYGAWIALNHALQSPERVRRLILLDPTQSFAGFKPGYLLHALPMLARPTARRARAFLAWETGGAAFSDAWLQLYARAAEFPRGRIVTGGRPQPAGLRALDVPTLALFAENSRAHDSHQAAAVARMLLGNATVAIIPGVSHHGLPMTEAEEVDTRILEFLASTAASESHD